MIKNPPLSQIEVPVLQAAANMIWSAAAWRWTVGSIGPVLVPPGSQAYTISGFPSDFLYLLRGYILDSSTGTEVKPVGNLVTTTSTNLINMPVYCAISGTSIQFDNIMPAVASGGVRSFYGYYKKVAPILTATFKTPGALIMDDDWFWVYQEAVLYYGYQYMDDQRAGAATTVVKDGTSTIQYSGQLGTVMASIEYMKTAETLVPAYPLVPPTTVKS